MAFFDIKPAVGITVEAAEGYDQSYSGMQALIEGYQNDYALFTGALYQDINEYSMVHEGASIGEVIAFQEASISGFFNKIKEFFKKLWAKIKALFHSFIAKFDSMFMKSGKALLKKYRKEIELKDTSDLEVKFSKPKIDYESKVKDKFVNVTVAPNEINNAKKLLDDFDANDFACTVVENFIGLKITDINDFDKDLHDDMFEDQDDVKWAEVKENVYKVLGNDKLVSTIQKLANNMDKAIADIIKDIDKAESQYTKDFKSDTEHKGIKTTYTATSNDAYATKATITATGDTDSSLDSSAEGNQKKQAVLSLLSKRASATQTAVNKISAGFIREVKFHASQCRAALAKAVAYKPKNEAAGLDTIADAVAYDPTILL